MHFGAGHLSWRNLPGSRGPGRIRRAGNAGPLAVSPQARADRRGDGVRVRPAPEQLSEFAGGAALGPRALPEDKSGPQERLASFWRSRASVPGEVTGGLGGAAAQAQGRRREASGTAYDPALAARLRAEDAAAARPLPPKARHRRLLPSQGPADSLTRSGGGGWPRPLHCSSATVFLQRSRSQLKPSLVCVHLLSLAPVGLKPASRRGGTAGPQERGPCDRSSPWSPPPGARGLEELHHLGGERRWGPRGGGSGRQGCPVGKLHPPYPYSSLPQGPPTYGE